MKVVEIRRPEELRELRPAWDSLVCASASRSIFLTWEWMTAWWSAYGGESRLRVWAAFDDDRILRGIAPLRERTVKRFGQAVTVLSFIGDGSNDSDYLDLVIAATYEEPVIEAFGRKWSEEWSRGAVLEINEIPSGSPNLPLLMKLAEREGATWKATETPCSTVRLPSDWDAYLTLLKPRFRTRVRSVLRNLEGRPEIRLGFCEKAGEVERLLPILYDLHTRRWVQDGKPGVFGWPAKRTFYTALSALLLERGWLRFSWLEWNRRVLACQYGFAYGGVYFQLQEGYEPASEHWNVGIGLRAWSIRELLKEQIRQYDFLGGAGRHKSDWGAEIKQSSRVEIVRQSYRNVLFCRGPEWEARARAFVRDHAPEKLLAARAAYREKRLAAPAAPGTPAAETAEMGVWQKTAAAIYYHCGLPKVSRPLREHYQASVARAGKLPMLTWTRRTQSSARILYYHRINDDGDPFFPAASTEVFDRHMRYVARHYHVVSLSGLLDHLEQGAPGTVVAITFDDGYEDNYHNGLPILKRYGLPATIFLTTGSLDSREPLWFEQLAEALKKTRREFVDVEIDIPRRFWTRTESERLESNFGIYALLRELPERDRQEWLARILRHLDAPELGERKGKMLTWDQVRLMQSGGIDFGGHTVTHPFLSRMDPGQVAWEAAECKRRIEEELQQPVDFFAYPSGREPDFGMWNKSVIRQAGYRAAMTTIWGMNYASTDPMELRRGGPWETSAAEFAYKLDWYQLVNG